jgi:uncharacterized protein YvpB
LLEKPLAEKMPESNQQTKQGEKKTLPAAAKISDVPLINQMDDPRLYNGCEVTSMAMIFNYHGMDVTKNELADKIKRVPLTYRNNLKGNPHDGFVGDMKNGPGLSVYHEPMQELAAQYVGTRAVDISGSPVRELYRYIAEGLPVWIITTSNLAPVDNFEKWKTPSGEIDVSFNVHSVTVTGYDKDAVYVNNPYGQKNQKVDKKDFEAAWKQMGSQAIVITN